MTQLQCGVRARVFPLLCAVALPVPDLSAARMTSARSIYEPWLSACRRAGKRARPAGALREMGVL